MLVIFKYILLFFCLCNGAPPIKRVRYTEEEEKIVRNEMLKNCGDTKPVPGKSARMWLKIAEKINEMRFINPIDFPAGKNSDSEQPYATLEADENGNKTRFGFEGWAKYTPEEDKFLINEVLSYPHRPVPIMNLHMWSEVLKRHNEKRIKYPQQFPHERSPDALRSHFHYLLRSKVEGQEKEKLMEVVTTGDKDAVKFKFWKRFTKAEDMLIIKELVHLARTSDLKVPNWQTIKAKHDKQRLSNTPGFFHERSVDSLRARFWNFLDKKGAIQQLLIEQLPQQFAQLKAATENASPIQGKDADFEETDEDEEESALWASMIEELLDDPADFDFTHL